ncbi:conserved exported hypothetical protein [Planktothrix serta PCC 8927]|uniref:Magnetosome protein MamS/MamX domain-containing protein n=1 Tax=Planktothrix serta PCC 8927 TaxID=671068 RepID=A0A7Z9BZS5_9CYAN|nr:hypothetical protein [Planktothrix serta]VXD24673.1 conserved exported hypothetical protein [Planktothrix serta PCC 8927]
MKNNRSKTKLTGVLIVTGIAFISLGNSPPLFAQPNSTSPQPAPTNGNNFYPPCQQLMGQNRPMMGQGGRGNRSGRKGQYSGPMYDPNRAETVQGTILEIQPGNRGNQMPHGMYLLMKTNTETLGLHVAPVWYLDQQNFQIQPNDTVEVTGTRIDGGGQPDLIVGEIKKGNQTLQLRDENGFPRWMGWQQQTPSN